MASAANKTLAASIAKSGSVKHCIRACLIASLSTFHFSFKARLTKRKSFDVLISKQTAPYPAKPLANVLTFI